MCGLLRNQREQGGRGFYISGWGYGSPREGQKVCLIQNWLAHSGQRGLVRAPPRSSPGHPTAGLPREEGCELIPLRPPKLWKKSRRKVHTGGAIDGWDSSLSSSWHWGGGGIACCPSSGDFPNHSLQPWLGDTDSLTCGGWRAVVSSGPGVPQD